MKLIEKLARECVEKRRQEIFDQESQPSDPAWFIPVYEAGFRKAREMIALLGMSCDDPDCDCGYVEKSMSEIRMLGEQEAE